MWATRPTVVYSRPSICRIIGSMNCNQNAQNSSVHIITVPLSEPLTGPYVSSRARRCLPVLSVVVLLSLRDLRHAYQHLADRYGIFNRQV